MPTDLPAEVFHLDELATTPSATTEAWQPFLQRPGLLVGLYRVAESESDEATHDPHEQDEVYYVIRGAGTISIDGQDHALTPGSIVFVQAGVRHHFHEVREDLSLLVFFAG